MIDPSAYPTDSVFQLLFAGVYDLCATREGDGESINKAVVTVDNFATAARVPGRRLR